MIYFVNVRSGLGSKLYSKYLLKRRLSRVDSWDLRSEEGRVGNELIRVAEELLPGPCCNPAAVSTSKMLSSRFPTAFCEGVRHLSVLAACSPRVLLHGMSVSE